MSGTYATSDLGLAGWLGMIGPDGRARLEMRKCERAENGKFEFIFNDPDNKGDEFAIAYLSTESAAHDQQVRNLKSLLSNRSINGYPLEKRPPSPASRSRW